MLVLINLETAAARRAAMARQLDKLGLAFERVGVDLRHADAAGVRHEIAAGAPGLRFHTQALSNAEIGCWLSHLRAWERLRRSGKPACAVIEDDLRLAPEFGHALDVLSAQDRFDLVYLGTSSRNVSQRRFVQCGSLRVHEPVGVILNTWGYVVTRAYVERFFAEGLQHAGTDGDKPLCRIRLPIDHFLGGRGGPLRPRIGVLQPAVVEEDPVLGAASQIGPYTRRLDRLHLLQRMRRRVLTSSVGQLYYSTVYRYL